MNNFIDHFIKCRRHIVSAYSLETLLRITSHPYLGQFVEVVMLDTDCVAKEVGQRCTGDMDEPFGWDRLRSVINQVLSQLKKHGNAITLGVTDYYPIRYGMRTVLDRNTHYPACFGEKEDYSVCPGAKNNMLSASHQPRRERHRIFDCLLKNATRLKLRIKGFKLELAEDPDPHSNICTQDAANFAKKTAQMLANSSDPISFSIEVARMASDPKKDLSVHWDDQNKSFDATGFIEWDSRSVYRNMVHPLLHKMTWVTAARITKLTLTNCRCRDDLDYLRFRQFIKACLGTLERLRMSVMLLRNEAKWSAVLRELEPALRLEKFELAVLEREIWSPDNQCACILQVRKWHCSGNEVSTELEDLAAAVEADESTWESLEDDNPGKWTHHPTTGRNKTSKKPLMDSESTTSVDDVDETVLTLLPLL